MNLTWSRAYQKAFLSLVLSTFEYAFFCCIFLGTLENPNLEAATGQASPLDPLVKCNMFCEIFTKTLILFINGQKRTGIYSSLFMCLTETDYGECSTETNLSNVMKKKNYIAMTEGTNNILLSYPQCNNTTTTNKSVKDLTLQTNRQKENGRNNKRGQGKCSIIGRKRQRHQ